MLDIAQKIDWREIEGTASKLLSRLVGYDTSNPPGNTSEAAKFLYETLNSEGIFATLIPSQGEKQNIVAQVDGAGKQEPLLLAGPLDVVGADPSGWSEFKPFSGYDDGRYIWGRGTIAAKSLLAAQVMALLLIRRLGVPLRRHLRFAAYTDGFGAGGGGLDYLVEHHLPLISAEHCIAWGFPPSVEIGGKTVFFIHRAVSDTLYLTMRAEGWGGVWGRGDAVRRMQLGVEAIEKEFGADHGIDGNTGMVFESMRGVIDDEPTIKALEGLETTSAGVSPAIGIGLFPKGFVDYVSSLCRTNISVTRLDAGSAGSVGARVAEADIAIRPYPGIGLQECGSRAVAALENLGPDAPYIARAEFMPGSVTEPDGELSRVLLAACRSVSPEAELAEGVTPFAHGLRALRQLGINVYGFHPLEFPDGFDDAAKRAFGCDERVAKFALGRMVRVMFEACVRFAS